MKLPPSKTIYHILSLYIYFCLTSLHDLIWSLEASNRHIITNPHAWDRPVFRNPTVYQMLSFSRVKLYFWKASKSPKKGHLYFNKIYLLTPQLHYRAFRWLAWLMQLQWSKLPHLESPDESCEFLRVWIERRKIWLNSYY